MKTPLTAIFLTTALVFGLLAAAVMDHSMPVFAAGEMAHSHSTVTMDAPLNQHAPESNPFTTCSELHAGFLNAFSQAMPGGNMLLMLALALAAMAVARLARLEIHAQPVLAVAQWRRYLFERIDGEFAIQPHFWLAILEKRDPGYAFVMA